MELRGCALLRRPAWVQGWPSFFDLYAIHKNSTGASQNATARMFHHIANAAKRTLAIRMTLLTLLRTVSQPPSARDATINTIIMHNNSTAPGIVGRSRTDDWIEASPSQRYKTAAEKKVNCKYRIPATRAKCEGFFMMANVWHKGRALARPAWWMG